MALTSALFTGLSGLDVNQTQLNVVGNNIANSNTTAFKSSRVLFTPQFYVTDASGTPPNSDNGGSNPSQHGLGASVASIEQDFTPGSIQPTGVDTDMAIDGAGFFVVKSSVGNQYTRDGAFSLNSSNQLVTGSGSFVQGFGANSSGVITPTLQNITIPLGASSASSPTTFVQLEGNLNASGTVANGAAILTSDSLTTVGGGAAPTTGSLLSTIASTANSGTPAFNVGDTLTLAGSANGRQLAPATFNVTATSTMGDLLNFYQDGLGIDTNVPAVPNVPAPGATLQADPNNANGVQINITSNEGTENALSISGIGFVNQSSQSPVTFTSNDSNNTLDLGQSVHTNVTTYDSLGNPVSVDVTAVLESESNAGNTWRFFATSPDNVGQGTTVLGNGTMTFDALGNLKATTGTSISVSRSGTGAKTPLSFNLDFSKMSELASNSSNMVPGTQDGMPPGTLNSFSIGTDGTISGSYSNGLTQTLGQVAVANFANPNGLNDLGGNIYAQGANSGVAAVSAPGQLGTGQIRAGALELSNVDLSKEFTNLIIASTGFSASSRVISTSDQLIQDLLNSTH